LLSDISGGCAVAAPAPAATQTAANSARWRNAHNMDKAPPDDAYNLSLMRRSSLAGVKILTSQFGEDTSLGGEWAHYIFRGAPLTLDAGVAFM
jgi:hypothetical protein